MTEQEILQQIDELQKKLEEIRSGSDASYVNDTIDEAEREKQHQEDLQRIRGFRLIDDDFMNACFDGYIEGTELLLRIILNKSDIRVNNVTTQKLMKNLTGRDIWLDIDADDTSGRKYNIEVQRADKGADRKRARYHSSILDAHLLRPGDSFGDLPETFVIFITENDVLKGDLPIYVIDRQIINLNQPFGDDEHIIYVNGADKDASTELGKLMHDFFCTSADDMYYKELADKVRYFKEDEKGVAKMCKVMEDMRNEAAQSAVEKDRERNAIEMLADGLSVERVAKYTQLAIERVRELAAPKIPAGETTNL